MRSAIVLAVVTLVLGMESLGATSVVRNKAEFLDALSAAVDSEGRLQQDLEITFAANCETMVVASRDANGEDGGCLLDCKGRRIRLDAGRCPCGAVVFEDSFTGCGKGSEFRNLTFINRGRIEFIRSENTLVKDCDFVNCGTTASSSEVSGGAIRGCAVVDGCGFDRCQARSGGALSDCGYVRECVFLNCRAYDGGGAIAGDTDVSRCEFHGCSCLSEAANDGFGGAVFGGRDIVSCLFVDCSAKRGGAVMSGGQRNGLHAKVVHCTFIRCQGEANDEAVYENSDNLPVWMLNCLFYGCAPCQDGADEDNKFSSYQLLDSGFFTDYARGDFHPNPNLPESWVDPCGLRFDDPDCGTQVFSCRDLDGYGYEFSSPWPNCPGCYRFRSDEYVSNIPSSTAKAGGGRISSRKVHSPSVRRGARTMRKQTSQFASGTSVRNRPIKVISRRTGPALMDLSELPCEFTQDEILHEDENLLDFTAPWYKLSGACERLFDLCGPVKMPEVGKDPGYGCPGKITPYAEDDELRSLERKYGFRSGWFHRGFPKKGDRYYQTYLDRLKCWEQRTNQVLDCQTCTVEKVPFLFSQASGKGKLPLVVYIAGSGEQGTDLKKMFGQTGVFDAVREPSFAMNCPCHLLAIMPPEFAHRLANVYYPHYYSHCTGQQLLDHPLYGLDLIRMYADLIFALQRELETKGKDGFDPSAIVLAGLGSGSNAALTMMREYPGRYAGVCATFPSMWYLLPTANRYRPGRWWFAVSEEYHENDERINAAVNACKQVGADVRLDYYPNGDNWWNRQYSSLEFQDWLVHCFESGILHGERLIVSRSERETDLLLAKTGPDEVTYYGTVRERPEGLPKEVADKRVKDMKGIRYLYVDGHVGAIPPEAFAHSPDLETVHFKLYAITNDAKSVHWKIDLTNIAERAFADSSKLKLVIYESAPAPKIAIDAFDGCAPQLYGATVGVPCTVSYWVGWGTSHAKYVTKKVNLNAQALPVDGLCSMRLFLCDDQLGRHLYIDDDYLWSEEAEGVNALMYLGESRDVFVPDEIRGRPVVAVGRNLLHRRGGGFEYGIVAFPATVRSAPLIGLPTIRTLFAAGAIPEAVGWGALFDDAVVYGTTCDKKSGRLIDSPFWKGKEVIVPMGTNPREYFAELQRTAWYNTRQ